MAKDSNVFEVDGWMRNMGLCVNVRGWCKVIYRGSCIEHINPSGCCGFLRHRKE